jgi:O-antigen/teichoic acid export membrane protein
MLKKLTQLKSHQGFRKYFANTSWLMGERILRMIVALFVGVYVARYLGPAQFGLLSYAGSFVGLFTALATLGLDGIVVRELVKTPERREELLGTAFWLKIGGAILMWITIIAAVPLTNNDIETNTLIAIIAFAAVFQAFNVIDFNFQAEVKSKYVVHAQLVQLLISSVAKLVLIFIEAPLLWFAWVYCLDAVVLAMGLAVMYLQNSGKFGAWQWRWQVARDLLRDSWPLILSGIVITINMKVDQVMLKELTNSTEVGLYAAAVNLSQGLYMLPMIFAQSFYPKFINLYNNKDKFYSFVQTFSSFMVIGAMILSIIISWHSNHIIYLLYGDSYAHAALILSIHVWTLVIVFMEVAFGRWLLIENKQKFTAYRNFFMALINIILNYYLIPIYGAIGAAVASLLSIFIGYYLFFAFFMETRKIFILQTKSILLLGIPTTLNNLFSNEWKK